MLYGTADPEPGYLCGPDLMVYGMGTLHLGDNRCLPVSLITDNIATYLTYPG